MRQVELMTAGLEASENHGSELQARIDDLLADIKFRLESVGQLDRLHTHLETINATEAYVLYLENRNQGFDTQNVLLDAFPRALEANSNRLELISVDVSRSSKIREGKQIR